MQNPTPVIDRAEVERIAYQAIGQQFRLPSLFSMLLLVVGFVLGHYVAARHTGDIADRFEERIAALQSRVDALGSGSAVITHVSADSAHAALRIADPAFEDGSDSSPFDSNSSNFRLAGMATTFDSTATDFKMLSHSFLSDVEVATATTTRAVIDDLRKAAVDERDACLAELQPYVDRRLSVPATMVVEVIETVYADQDRRLAAAVDDAAAKATGLDPRDTSVKIFPPMSEDGAADPMEPKTIEVLEPVGHRYFPKPSAPRSMFFSPVRPRVPAPATSAMDTEAVLR